MERHLPTAKMSEEIIAQPARVVEALRRLAQADALLDETGVSAVAKKLRADSATELPLPVDLPTGLLLNARLRLSSRRRRLGEIAPHSTKPSS